MNKAPAPVRRLYGGRRSEDGTPEVAWIDPNHAVGALDLAIFVRHVADGFEWGIATPKARQLALALVYDATGNGYLAKRVMERFEHAVISRFTRDDWQIRAEDIATKARLLDQGISVDAEVR